jgi:hypothetical protein
VIVALAVVALSGGFGGFGALGQLISGPAVPVGSLLSGGRAAPRTAPVLLPVVPASTATGRAPTRVAATIPGAARTARPRPGRGAHAGGGGAERVGSGHGATPPVATPPSPSPQPAPPPGPPPPSPGPVPALVDQVVAVGVSVTSKLPAPLAAIGSGALESLGQTLNTLLAPQS